MSRCDADVVVAVARIDRQRVIRVCAHVANQFNAANIDLGTQTNDKLIVRVVGIGGHHDIFDCVRDTLEEQCVAATTIRTTDHDECPRWGVDQRSASGAEDFNIVVAVQAIDLVTLNRRTGQIDVVAQ
jgi:hypothetical protein